MNWKNITVAKAVEAVPAAPVLKPSITDLEEAAKRWDARSDSFAQGKNVTCRDIAAKLRRFGSYASEAQRGFAEKLVAWSLPRKPVVVENAAPAAPDAPVIDHRNMASVPLSRPGLPQISLPDTFAVMQKFSKFTVGDLTIARKNQDSLCWIKFAGCDRVVGKIENGTAVLWPARLSTLQLEEAKRLLAEIEANPLETAMKYGKLSGRCCMCGRDLTDPVSIERGIGPICLNGFGGF
jgi:hypothetical protein